MHTRRIRNLYAIRACIDARHSSNNKGKQRETEEAKGKQITLIAYKRTPKNNPQCCCPLCDASFRFLILKTYSFAGQPLGRALSTLPILEGSIWINSIVNFSILKGSSKLVYFCAKHLPHSSMLLSDSLSDNCVRSTSDSIMKALSANGHQTSSPQYLNYGNELRHKN